MFLKKSLNKFGEFRKQSDFDNCVKLFLKKFEVILEPIIKSPKLFEKFPKKFKKFEESVDKIT